MRSGVAVRRRQASHPLAILALVLVNLIPLYGVIFSDWSVAMVLYLYWAETVIVGIFAILKLPWVAGWESLFLIPFFCMHFGIFMFVHVAFLGQFVSKDKFSFSPSGEIERQLGALKPHWAWVLGAMVASHGVSYVLNFLKRHEEQALSTMNVMVGAYARVIAMHVAVVIGGFFVMGLGEATGVLVILVLMKLAFDLFAHTREHSITAWIERAEEKL